MEMSPLTLIVFGGMLLISLVMLITTICEIKKQSKNDKSDENYIENFHNARMLVTSSIAIITFSTILIGNII